MPSYTLNVFDLTDISTDDPDGFSNNGGYQFDWGTSTVTIAQQASAIPVDLTDNTDEFFDDDAGPDQVSNQQVTLNGVTYPPGTNMEAEYKIDVQDSLGNVYTLQFVSMANDAYDIAGFVIQGSSPPFGEPLTVVSTQDVANGQYRYDTSQAPTCFAVGTRVATARGDVRVENLRLGDHIVGTDGVLHPVALVLRCRETISRAERAPIRLRAGALGPGMPARCLVLSPHHRVYLAPLAGLAPAKALDVLRGVGPWRQARQMDWVHVVTRRHVVLLAEGVPCESFWPGPLAMGALPRGLRRRVNAAMGRQPEPALPLLTVQLARQRLQRFLKEQRLDQRDGAEAMTPARR